MSGCPGHVQGGISRRNSNSSWTLKEWAQWMELLNGESGVNSGVATTVSAAGVEKDALMWFFLPTEVVSQLVISGICK
ncbi:unnamed protein product [Sphagnum troendelagicum]|uniref:Uncharacterized protein n=1 Tax=Sphagnum troendelagicum TaxID=128251 RepID=A0ABP0V0A6_9BRYO